jgi:1-deoxy-D-xylulose 5-phosphate reductoisomerase
VLNAANEVAVERFLGEEIGYRDIPAVVAAAMDAHTPLVAADLGALRAADRWARSTARAVRPGTSAVRKTEDATSAPDGAPRDERRAAKKVAVAP